MKNFTHICPHEASSQFETAQGAFCIDCGSLRAFSVTNKQSVQLNQAASNAHEQINFYESLSKPSPKTGTIATQKSPKRPRTPSIIDIRGI